MNKASIAYIAGLIDREGYLGIKKSSTRKDCQNPTYQPRIQIRMTDEEAIEFITNELGGSYYKEKPHAKNGKPLYCFSSANKMAIEIIETIFPFLKVKKAVAKVILKFRKLQHKQGKYRTKVTSYTEMPHSKTGETIKVPHKSLNEKYIKKCEEFYQKCKEINKTGAK